MYIWLYPVVAEALAKIRSQAGMFSIHGAEHEITVPARVELASDHWSLTVHFAVPYVKWGMKDPSTFILRVEKKADIELHAPGPSPWVAPR